MGGWVGGSETVIVYTTIFGGRFPQTYIGCVDEAKVIVDIASYLSLTCSEIVSSFFHIHQSPGVWGCLPGSLRWFRLELVNNFDPLVYTHSVA